MADVHGILYLTVYDEDKNHKSEFLGRIAVPLLKMEVSIISDKTFDGIVIFLLQKTTQTFLHFLSNFRTYCQLYALTV